MTDSEAVHELLPGSRVEVDANGELTMQMDGTAHSGLIALLKAFADAASTPFQSG
jgi:hypothetical protein